MSDYGHRETDYRLAELESRISSVYKDASDDMTQTVRDYFAQFANRDAEQKAALEAGDISKQEYTQWRLTQIGRGERYQTMRDKLAERYTDANEVAVSYVNDATPGIYSLNRNYSAYTIEQSGADVDFTLFDEQTVKRLIVEQPNLMPNYPEAKAVARGIDLAYGKEQITASVTSGILQGNSVYKIADDLMKRITTMSETSAIRTARTAFTEAENAGRQDSYEAAEAMGIPMQKRWVATLDDRTRESHIEADGQTVSVDDNFKVGDGELEYPGDADGEPAEVYNCRCTVIAVVDGVDYKDGERRGEGERFEAWMEKKEAEQAKLSNNPLLKELQESNIDYREVKDLTKPLTEQEIIDKLGGGDQTAGSCASLALAYAGNQCGYDVTDYRGGESQKWFSRNYWKMVESDANFLGKSENGFLPSNIYTARSQVTAGNKALKALEAGNEYILCCGRHAAIVQKTDEGILQYLELQDPLECGWTDFDGNPRYTLSWRFGCQSSGDDYSASLTNINDLKNNETFKKALGYINTATDKQKKGNLGNAK